jgi:class 3 adenylate cyclase/pimeloyl-ACP methyl ester carboxylesterase
VVRRLTAILAADVFGYSRMMSEDEAGTLASLQAHRSQLLDPAITRHHGRVVKLMGDGLLAEFASVVEAVDCAAEIQREMAARNAGAANKGRMIFRVGVHLGDVIVEGDDIYGDGVNIAARLEGIAEPGGICISRQVYDQVQKKLALGYRNLGPQNLKNIPDPVEVFAIKGDGLAVADDRQEIRYCRALDRVRLAYAISGTGPPLVKTANWMNHLEYDWQSPIFHHLFYGLALNRTLIRYDARGNGLSDWDVPELSLDSWVSDLETVVEAAGLKRFPLFGISQGCAISVAYAARHPERVSHLILLGGYVIGGNKRTPANPGNREKRKALATLIRLEWGADSAALRQMFTMQLVPDATKEQADSFNELQRRTTSPEMACRYFEASGEVDTSDFVGKVTAPTLVLHARGDLQVPFEAGRQLAAAIPGARFVALQGRNHLLLEGEPDTKRFFEELELFLAT